MPPKGQKMPAGWLSRRKQSAEIRSRIKRAWPDDIRVVTDCVRAYEEGWDDAMVFAKRALFDQVKKMLA